MEGLQLLPAKNLRQSSVTFQAEGLVGPRHRALLSKECQVAALCENSSCCQFGIPISPGKSPCSLVWKSHYYCEMHFKRSKIMVGKTMKSCSLHPKSLLCQGQNTMLALNKIGPPPDLTSLYSKRGCYHVASRGVVRVLQNRL